MALTTNLALQLQATLSAGGSGEVYSAEDSLSFILSNSLTHGWGADQANAIWHDRRTLASGDKEILNLSDMSLLNAFGVAFAPGRVKVLIVRNRSTQYPLTIAPATDNGDEWTSFLNANGVITLRPGGWIAVSAPDALAYVVGSGENCELKISHPTVGGSIPSIEYDIVLIGA